MHLRNIGLDDEGLGERMNEQFRVAFAEDKAILEAIQARENKPPARRGVKLAIDRGPNHLRRIINEMLAEEAPPAEEERAPMEAAV
jgi:vanillate O-demethylase monooxygenase subunit